MKQHLNATSIAERVHSLMGVDNEVAFARRLGIAEHSIARFLQGQVPDPITLVRIAAGV